MQTTGDGKRLLSFDGGAARSLSQLRILANVMHRIQYDRDKTKIATPIKPCEYFDLAVGTGTGGLLVILIVRLRLSIADATREFEIICDRVYSQRQLTPSQRSFELKSCLEALLVRYGFAVNAKLCDYDKKEEVLCDGFILAKYSANVNTVVKLRTYQTRTCLPSNITIISAALATCATPDFSPVTLGELPTQEELVSACTGTNNPAREVIEEALVLFGSDARVAVLLSLGTGHPGVIGVSSTSSSVSISDEESDSRPDSPCAPGAFDNKKDEEKEEKIRQERWNDILTRMAEDSESTAREMEKQLGGLGLYFRFSVQQGMQRHLLPPQYTTTGLKLVTSDINNGFKDDVKIRGDFFTYTSAYLDSPEVNRRLDTCITCLESRIGLATLEAIRGTWIGREVIKTIPPLVPYFVMRDEPYMNLLEGLFGDDGGDDAEGQKVVVLTGAEGVGKTQLVSRFVKEFRDRYQHIIFINGSTESSIAADLISNIRILTNATNTLNSPMPNTPITTTHLYLSNPSNNISITDALSFLSLPSNPNWLIILDNLGQTDIPLAHYLPSCDHGHVIATSRERGWAALGNCWVELGEMKVEESVETMMSAGKIPVNPFNRVAIKEMVQTLEDRTPIKLVEAGRKLTKSGELASLVKKYVKPGMDLVSPSYSSNQLPKSGKDLLRYVTTIRAYKHGDGDMMPSSPTASFVESISDIDDGRWKMEEEGERLVGDLIRRRSTMESMLGDSSSVVEEKIPMMDEPPSYEEMEIPSKPGMWKYVLLFILSLLISVYLFLFVCP